MNIKFELESFDDAKDIFHALMTMRDLKEDDYLPIIKTAKTKDDLIIGVDILNKNNIDTIKKVVKKYNLDFAILDKYKYIDPLDYLWVLD